MISGHFLTLSNILLTTRRLAFFLSEDLPYYDEVFRRKYKNIFYISYIKCFYRFQISQKIRDINILFFPMNDVNFAIILSNQISIKPPRTSNSLNGRTTFSIEKRYFENNL